MKLKHFFRPQDASFSTSIAARTLLRSFFVALLLSLLGGLYVYINSSFDREISQRRGYMSGAILEAQRFFTGHEMLLKNLSLAAVRNKPVSPAAPMDPRSLVAPGSRPCNRRRFRRPRAPIFRRRPALMLSAPSTGSASRSMA